MVLVQQQQQPLSDGQQHGWHVIHFKHSQTTHPHSQHTKPKNKKKNITTPAMINMIVTGSIISIWSLKIENETRYEKRSYWNHNFFVNLKQLLAEQNDCIVIVNVLFRLLCEKHASTWLDTLGSIQISARLKWTQSILINIMPLYFNWSVSRTMTQIDVASTFAWQWWSQKLVTNFDDNEISKKGHNILMERQGHARLFFLFLIKNG